MSEQLRAGEVTLQEFHEAEGGMNRSAGHCMTMGTGSTMASMVEALGVGLPENAAIPAATRAATSSPAWPDGASSRWCTRISCSRRS